MVRFPKEPNEFDQFVDISGTGEMYSLFIAKTREYGNAIEDTGVLGAVTALTGDCGRLRTLVLKDPKHGRQAAANVRDKLLDVAVQAVIGIMMLDNNNWEGKDSEDPIR